MANTGLSGIDVRQTANELVFRAFFTKTSGAALETGGTVVLRIYELQSDGTLSSYDFNTNTFKTTALTTETQALTQRTGNNATFNTGIWTFSLGTLTGFTKGAIYFAHVNDPSADIQWQCREFQFGGAQGDLTVDTHNNLNTNAHDAGGTAITAGAIPTAAAGANGGLPTVDANNNIHGMQPGTGTGQLNPSGGKVPATIASTDVTGNVACDLQTIKTQTVTCAAGVTVGAFVGNATHAIAVDSSGNVTFNNTSIATVTNLTNSPTSGDLTAAMKTSVENAVWNAATASHTTAGTYGLLIATDLDAAVSSRMATYTQPTGFLSASFPTTVASPTNITAGTITTVSGDVEGKVLGGGASALTGTGVRAVDASGNALGTAANQTTIITDIGLCQQAGAAVTLPGIPANWITAAGIAAGALNGKGDWATAGAQMDLVSAPNATALAAIANAYLGLADGIEVGITPLQAERAMLAALCGILASSGANPEVFKNPAGTATRVSVANDAAGNRTAVTITA